MQALNNLAYFDPDSSVAPCDTSKTTTNRSKITWPVRRPVIRLRHKKRLCFERRKSMSDATVSAVTSSRDSSKYEDMKSLIREDLEKYKIRKRNEDDDAQDGGVDLLPTSQRMSVVLCVCFVAISSA